MKVPDDLPEILELRFAFGVRSQLPRRPVDFISSSGKTNASQICPQIPYGCEAWRMAGQKEWKPLYTIPKHWMPFVNRERPGPMDCRPLPRFVPLDAIRDGGDD